MGKNLAEELSPADVLAFIRDAEFRAWNQLDRKFCPQQPTSPARLRKIGRLHAILGGLEEAGLVIDREKQIARTDDPSGSGTSYAATPLVAKIQQALELSLSRLARAQTTRQSDSAGELAQVAERAKTEICADAVYRDDLVASLREMRECFEAGCYIAVMGLGGKILELGLKQRMIDLDFKFDDNWMLGTLVSKLGSLPQEYVDPALGNLVNIINQSRIPAVHAKRAIPIPSRDQAVMVVAAVIDVLNRTIFSATAPKPH
jgi:hypothetical protein